MGRNASSQAGLFFDVIVATVQGGIRISCSAWVPVKM